MSRIIGEGPDAVIEAGGGQAAKRTCNKHDDCDAADERAKARGESHYGRPGASHCHSDDCEECFGS